MSDARPEPPGPRRVRCPICLDTFVWNEDEPFVYEDGRYEPLAIDHVDDLVKREYLMRKAFVRCPNPSGDTREHFLPFLYARYGDPLVIGMVGTTRTGKTHLLAAMIGEIVKGGLSRYGLSAVAVDELRHEQFLHDSVIPLFDGVQLPYTAITDLSEFVDALIITPLDEAGGPGRPVAFFDVSGDQLANVERNERFFSAADAMIFVVDPEQALRLPGLSPTRAGLGDPSFSLTLDRLYRGQTYVDLPVAVVLAKCDRLRFLPPVDHWLSSGSSGRLDAELIRSESASVYAFLHQHGAEAWLSPVARCRRVTLHFASATGTRAREERFLRGVQPLRVLEPLISLLAMSDVIKDPEAAEVGR